VYVHSGEVLSGQGCQRQAWAPRAEAREAGRSWDSRDSQYQIEDQVSWGRSWGEHRHMGQNPLTYRCPLLGGGPGS
jgi:hypothetical protein